MVRVLGWLALLARSDAAKDAEIPSAAPGDCGLAAAGRASQAGPTPAPGHLPPHHRRAQLRHSPAAAVGDVDPDHPAGGPDRDRLPLRARAAVPDAVAEQLTSSAASSQRGCPGPGTPAVNTRATRARSARPAIVTLSRTALVISASAFPVPPRVPGNHPGRRRAHRDARPTRRRASSRETRRQRGPSVAVRGKADGAHLRLHVPRPEHGAPPSAACPCARLSLPDARTDTDDTVGAVS
jgi:hypothetical protein